MKRVMNTILPLMSMTEVRQGRSGKLSPASFSNRSDASSRRSSSWLSNYRQDRS